MMQILTEKNIIIYLAQNYNNLQCSSTEEFDEDIKRFKYIKKLITRYIKNGTLKERLILNHLIILNNVFNTEILCRVIYLKMEKQMKYVKPFLIYLGLCLDNIVNVKKEQKIDLTVIAMDPIVIKALRDMDQRIVENL